MSHRSPLRPPDAEPSWVAPFLEALAAGLPIARAARMAHVGLSHAYAYRAATPAFRAAWEARHPPHVNHQTAPAEEWQQAVGRALAQGSSLDEVARVLHRTLHEPTVEVPTNDRPGTDRARSRHRTDWQRAFLQALEAGRTVIQACMLAGIVPNTAYTERRRNAAFGIAWSALYQRPWVSRRMLPSNWQAIFLTALTTTGTVLAACRGAGIAVTTAYVERRRNPAFARDWETVSVQVQQRGMDVATIGQASSGISPSRSS